MALKDLMDLPDPSKGKARPSSYAEVIGEEEESPLPSMPARLIKGGERILGGQSDIATRGAYLPLAQRLSEDDPLALARLRELQHKTSPLYLGDVLTAKFPILEPKSIGGGFEPTLEHGTARLGAGIASALPGLARETGKFAARFAADVVGDPLTYETLGASTPKALGIKAINAAKEASKTAKLAGEASEGIKIGSKLSKQASKITGLPESAEAIRRVPKLKGGSLAEQVKSGERSLASIYVPGKGNVPLPLIGTGKVAGALATPLSAVGKLGIVQKLEGAARKVFSSKTGTSEYDELVTRMRDLLLDRTGFKIQEGRVLAENLDVLTRELGKPREELNKLINEIVEKEIPVDISKLGQEAPNAATQQLRQSRKGRLPEATPTPDVYVPPQPPTAADAKIQKVAQDLAERQVRQLLIEQTSGVRVIPMLADREYLPHIMTDQARKLYKEALIRENKIPRGMGNREFNEFLVNSLRREFVKIKPDVVESWMRDGLITAKKAQALRKKDGLSHLDDLLEKGNISEADYAQAIHTLSVEEVNEIARTQGLSLLGIKDIKLVGKSPKAQYNTVDEFFHTDPVYYSTIRGIRGERARTAAEFYTELKARGIAVLAKEAPTSHLPVPQPELAGFHFEPGVARHLTKMHNFATNPKEIHDFLKVFDATQNWWKTWSLAIFPAYHSRNFVGNMWNNWLAGITNPKWYYLAEQARHGRLNKFTDAVGKTWTAKELQEKAGQLGVLNRGWFGGDIEQTLRQKLGGTSLNPLKQDNRLTEAGFEFGRGVENNARMAHFMAKLAETGSANEAALSVKKYLFDYSDLTDIEKIYFKRLFPFYTWSRKNIPLQLTELIKQPAKFSNIYKARTEFERGTPGIEDKYLAPWMLENFPVRVRYNEKENKYEYFLLNSWLPAYDIVKLADLKDMLVGMTSPIPKELLQQLFNYDAFLKRKIEDIPGQKDKFLGMNLPKRVVHGAKLIRLLNEIDKLTKEDQTLFAKVLGLATGKTYSVDPDKAYNQNKYRVDEDMEALRGVLRKELAKPNANENEIERIEAMIRDKAGEY